MSDKLDIQQLIRADGDELQASFARVLKTARPDEKGDVREQRFRQFLKDWLPSKYGVTHGYCIDCHRDASRECDVLLFDEANCPKMFVNKNDDLRLVPYNFTFGSIEVKSTLNSQELADANEKAATVIALRSLLQGYDEYGEAVAALAKRTGRRDDRTRDRSHYDVGAGDDEQWEEWNIRSRSAFKTKPFCFVFAYRLGKGLSDLNGVEAALRESKSKVSGVCILDQGVIIRSSGDAFRRYKSIKKGKHIGERDWDVLRARLEAMWTSESKYIIESTTDEGLSLRYFLSFLLFLLEQQRSGDESATDILAAWHPDGKRPEDRE